MTRRLTPGCARCWRRHSASEVRPDRPLLPPAAPQRRVRRERQSGADSGGARRRGDPQQRLRRVRGLVRFAARPAAYSESRVATATALTNAGTIVSIPDRNTPLARLPGGLTPDRVAARSAARRCACIRTFPPASDTACSSAGMPFELVGLLDADFSPGYEEEVDFSQRCVLHGLRHVVADDVFVFHHHARSFGSGAEAAQLRISGTTR